MEKNRKLELQEKIIRSLMDENTALSQKNHELENTIRENNKVIEAANQCITEYTEIISSLKELKIKYMEAIDDIKSQKNKYQKEMNGVLKTIKRNI